MAQRLRGVAKSLLTGYASSWEDLRSTALQDRSSIRYGSASKEPAHIEVGGMSEPKIIVLDDAQALHKRAAEEIAHLSGDAICTHAEFTFCLSGGLTPAAVYELLGSRFLLSVDWNEVHFFWGDERCVPPDNEKSNYAMTQRTMLSKLPVKPSQIHRIQG